MGEASVITKKVFLNISQVTDGSNDILRSELRRSCRAHGLSMGNLIAADGLAFIQAVAHGCQLIVLDEAALDCSAAASFAATAALSGYSLAVVTGNETQYDAAMRMLMSQQSSGTSLQKLLFLQPGHEAQLAAAILAPVLFRETILGPLQKHSAGGLLVASAETQQAYAKGPAPLMLLGQPQEAADASSGQTQQILKNTPQHCNRHEQQRGANEEGVQPTIVGKKEEANTAHCIGKHAVQPDAPCAAPDVSKSGAAPFEELPAAAPSSPNTEQERTPDPALPISGAGQPADEQAEVVDLISDSDDERAGFSASQPGVTKNSQPVPSMGGGKTATLGAAVRRSSRISSQGNSETSESEGEHGRVERSTKWLRACRKRGPEAAQPKAKRSRLGKAQVAPADAAARHVKPKPVKAKGAADGAKRAAKPRPPPAETQPEQRKKQTVRQGPGDTRAGGSAGAGAASTPPHVLQGEDSEWSTEPEGAHDPLGQGNEPAQSSKAPVNATPRAEVADPTCPGVSLAGKSPATTAQHAPKKEAASTRTTAALLSIQKAKYTKALAPFENPASDTGLASMRPEISQAQGKLPFSQAHVDGLLAAFEQNRCSQVASQSPAKKYKWLDKGKAKVSELPRDPQQPGPSNAVYSTPAEELEDSDDGSFDLNTPFI